MRRLFRVGAGYDVVHQFFDLVGHPCEQACQTVDLLALIDHDTVQVLDRPGGVRKIDFKLLDPLIVIG